MTILISPRPYTVDVKSVLLFEALDLDRASETEVAYHLPPDIIARWDVVRRELRGLEREMVAQHLSRCAECREDLELLGYSPALDPLRGDDRATIRPGMLERLTRRMRGFFDAPLRWIPAAVAAAIALVLLVPRGDGPTIYLTASVPESVPTLTLTGTTRSFDVPTIEIKEGTTRVGIDVSQLAFYVDVDPAEIMLEVTLVDPNDVAFSLGTMNAGEFKGMVVNIGNGRDPIIAGLYRLEVLVTAPGRTAVTRDLPFEITSVDP